MKNKKTKKSTKISRKETSHEKWLEGYWKWRKTITMANKNIDTTNSGLTNN